MVIQRFFQFGCSSLLLSMVGCLAGCGGDAKVELVAADAMDSLGVELSRALEEYHAELARMDDERQRAVVRALIERVRTDAGDEAALDAHADAFEGAMSRLGSDREAAWRRFTVSEDNLALLSEVSAGVRRLALDSLTLHDEARRYFGEALQKFRKPDPAAAQAEGSSQVKSVRKVTP